MTRNRKAITCTVAAMLLGSATSVYAAPARSIAVEAGSQKVMNTCTLYAHGVVSGKEMTGATIEFTTGGKTYSAVINQGLVPVEAGYWTYAWQGPISGLTSWPEGGTVTAITNRQVKTVTNISGCH